MEAPIIYFFGVFAVWLFEFLFKVKQRKKRRTFKEIYDENKYYYGIIGFLFMIFLSAFIFFVLYLFFKN